MKRREAGRVKRSRGHLRGIGPDAPRRRSVEQRRLRPRSGPVQRAFRDIVLRGRGFVLERMAIRETNGDETVTTFTEVDDARRYTPDELARLFRVDAR